MDDATKPSPTSSPIRSQPKRRMPIQWERFAARVACGDTLVDAMRKAYPARRHSQPATIAVDASRLAKRPEVAEMIERFRREEMRGCLLSRDERLQILGQIAKSKTSKPTEKVSAITAYTKIVGDAAPERTELDLKGQLSAALTHTDLTVQDRAAQLMKELEADDPTKL